jgi:chromosome segregation ATPase
MTGQDESLTLPEVKGRFAEAGEALAGINATLADIKSASSQLGEARTAIKVAAAQVGELAGTLEGLTHDLIQATEVIEKSDPAAVLARLDEADERSTKLASALDEVDTKVVANGTKTDALDKRVQTVESNVSDVLTAVGSVRTLVLVALVLAFIAAGAAIWGLVG